MEGSVSVSLSATSNYQATETFTQRVYRGATEHLVKWCDCDKTTAHNGLCGNYTVWMREEEMMACCPHLLTKETTQRGGAADTHTEGACLSIVAN